MKPQSNLKYYKHNKGKLALLVIPLFLSMVLLYTVHMVIASFYDAQYNAFVETRKYYTSIQAVSSVISNDTIDAITHHENTKKLIPGVLGFTEINGVLSTIGVRVYFLYQNDMIELAEKMNLVLASGRLPTPGEKEIVLHEAVLKNKGLSIGDAIGSDVVSGERLTGQYSIVGALEGKALAGFAPLETWQNERAITHPEQIGVLIFAEEKKLNELNRYLSYLPMTGNELSSYQTSSTEYAKSSGNIYLIMNIIYGSVLIIVSICLGFLTYLFYHSRLKEFAILYVIGYSKQKIILRNIADVLAINVASALVAILCAIGIGAVLDITIFEAMGTPLLLFDIKTVVLSLCIPLLCIVSQSLSIGLSFQSADMVSIIELESGGVS